MQTLLVIGAGFFGIHVTKSLSATGFRAPDAESSQVADVMPKTFGPPLPRRTWIAATVPTPDA
jgi:hypothetical protein